MSTEVNYVGIRKPFKRTAFGTSYVPTLLVEVREGMRIRQFEIKPSGGIGAHFSERFDWGNDSTASTQLALAILVHAADHFYGLEAGSTWRKCLCKQIDPSDRPCIVCEGRGNFRKEGRSRAMKVARTFRWKHVEKFPHEGFRLRLVDVMPYLYDAEVANG